MAGPGSKRVPRGMKPQVENPGKIFKRLMKYVFDMYGGRMIIKLVARDNIPFEIEQIVLIDSAGVMPKRSFKQKVRVFRYKIL